MAIITTNWSAQGGISNRRVSARKKGDTTWISNTGFSPGNDLSSSTTTANYLDADGNTIYQFKVNNLCGGTLSSDSIIAEGINFQCFNTSVTSVSDTQIIVQTTNIPSDIEGITYQLFEDNGTTVVVGQGSLEKTPVSGTTSHTFSGLTPSHSYKIGLSGRATLTNGGVPETVISSEYVCQIAQPTSAGCLGVTVPAFTLPDASSGAPYNYNVTLSGTQLFALTITSKPPWMTISITGNILNFQGTAPTTASDVFYDVDINVSNCSGANTQNISKTFTNRGTGTAYLGYKVYNNTTNGAVLTNVTNATVSVGETPAIVYPTTFAEASIISNIYSFRLYKTGPAAKVELYVNGLLLQSIPMPTGAASQQFQAGYVNTTDLVEIKLIDP